MGVGCFARRARQGQHLHPLQPAGALGQGHRHHCRFSRTASQQSPSPMLSEHMPLQRDASDAASHRNCDPATPPARRRPVRSWAGPSPAFAARGNSVPGCSMTRGNGSSKSSKSSCNRRNSRQGIARQTARCTDRPYHLDWGCTWRYVALVLLAFVLATALPLAASEEVGVLKQYSTWCGDNVCEGRIENRGWCAVDCSCGDGVCDDVEATSASCPQDCLSHVGIVFQVNMNKQTSVCINLRRWHTCKKYTDYDPLSLTMPALENITGSNSLPASTGCANLRHYS